MDLCIIYVLYIAKRFTWILYMKLITARWPRQLRGRRGHTPAENYMASLAFVVKILSKKNLKILLQNFIFSIFFFSKISWAQDEDSSDNFRGRKFSGMKPKNVELLE